MLTLGLEREAIMGRLLTTTVGLAAMLGGCGAPTGGLDGGEVCGFGVPTPDGSAFISPRLRGVWAPLELRCTTSADGAQMRCQEIPTGIALEFHRMPTLELQRVEYGGRVLDGWRSTSRLVPTDAGLTLEVDGISGDACITIRGAPILSGG